MSTNNDVLLQRVQASYQRLTSVASTLNAVSDGLGKSISALDESLKSLNLGISCWHKIAGDEHESGLFWAHSIGYAKLGKWGIALSKTSGDSCGPPEYGSNEQWLFNDAPRELRLEAIEHIPALIETLINAAEESVEKIKAKTFEAQKLAEALSPGAKPVLKTVLRNTQ